MFTVALDIVQRYGTFETYLECTTFRVLGAREDLMS